MSDHSSVSTQPSPGRALVTGATGFLGRVLAEQLIERGDRVRALCRREAPELVELGVEIARGDVRDTDAVTAACEGIDTVYHAASVAGIWGPWKHFYSTNTVGTRNVISSCQAQGVKKLIYTSSPSVTFDGSPQEGIDESQPYSERWLCHYPHSKALAEQAVLKANRSMELLTCSLRPHLIWGPGDRHLIPRLLARARQGRLRRVGDGSNLIDMIFVDNAARAHLLAADALQPDSPVSGQAYFISQGQPVNCWQWIDQLLGLAGLGPVSKSISLKSAWRIGACLEGVYRTFRVRAEPPMTRFLAAQLGTSHYFDINRARDDFGYQACVSVEQGMDRLAATFRE